MARPAMASKKVLTRNEWDKALNKEPCVSLRDLNRLVMDYLVIEGYQGAAEAFALETGLKPSVHLDSIAARMHIRTAVQTGDIDSAIRQVKQLEAEALDRDPALLFRLRQQRLIELIRHGQTLDALAFASDELAPMCEETPALLPQLERTMALFIFDLPSGKPTSGVPTASKSSSAGLAPPPVVAELLAPAHRLQTAGELNAAILMAQNQSRDPKLLQLLRMLLFGEHALGPDGPGKVSFPPLDLSSLVDRQPGLTSAPTTTTTTTTTSTMATAPPQPPPATTASASAAAAAAATAATAAAAAAAANVTSTASTTGASHGAAHPDSAGSGNDLLRLLQQAAEEGDEDDRRTPERHTASTGGEHQEGPGAIRSEGTGEQPMLR